MKLALAIIASILLFTACQSKFMKVLKSTDYEYKLKSADEYFEAKKYSKAQELYTELFPVFKGTDKFEELYYKYAYCSFYMKEFQNAESLFSDFLGVFPNSPKAEEVAYMQAFSYYKQSPQAGLDQVNTFKSIGMMQSYINTYPNSPRVKEANEIINLSRVKLEQKDLNAAKLYYDLSQYKAAGISYTELINNYPESPHAENYMLMVVKSYYQYAKLSIPTKQEERYSKVLDEYLNFQDRFPESHLLKEAENYRNLSQNNIKQLQNEQAKTPAGR